MWSQHVSQINIRVNHDNDDLQKWFLGDGEGIILQQPGTEIPGRNCEPILKKSGHTTEEPAQQPEAQQSLVLMLRSAEEPGVSQEGTRKTVYSEFPKSVQILLYITII